MSPTSPFVASMGLASLVRVRTHPGGAFYCLVLWPVVECGRRKGVKLCHLELSYKAMELNTLCGGQAFPPEKRRDYQTRDISDLCQMLM